MNNLIIKISLVFLIFIAFILETTIINFPFIFFIGAILLYIYKKVPIYAGVFFMGLVIDALRVSNFGLTSLFLFSTIILMNLYEKYSGSSDAVIAAIVIALIGFFYTQFLNYSLGLTVFFMAICTIIWVSFRVLQKKRMLFA